MLLAWSAAATAAMPYSLAPAALTRTLIEPQAVEVIVKRGGEGWVTQEGRLLLALEQGGPKLLAEVFLDRPRQRRMRTGWFRNRAVVVAVVAHRHPLETGNRHPAARFPRKAGSRVPPWARAAGCTRLRREG